MKKVFWIIVTTISFGTAAFAASDLYSEFLRRDSIRLNLEQGNAIKFLKQINFPTEKITQLEILTEGTFAIQDNQDIICFGNINHRMLRCKNRIGLTTVTFDGDAD